MRHRHRRRGEHHMRLITQETDHRRSAALEGDGDDFQTRHHIEQLGGKMRRAGWCGARVVVFTRTRFDQRNQLLHRFGRK